MLKQIAVGQIVQSPVVRSRAVRQLVALDKSEPTADTFLSCLRADDALTGTALLNALGSSSVDLRKLLTQDISSAELQEIIPRLLELLTNRDASDRAMGAIQLLDDESLLVVLRSQPETIASLVRGLTFTNVVDTGLVGLIFGLFSGSSTWSTPEDHGVIVRSFSRRLLDRLGDSAVGPLGQTLMEPSSTNKEAIIEILATRSRDCVLAEIKQRAHSPELIAAMLATIAHSKSDRLREFALSVMADRNGEQLSRALWLHPDELPTLLTSILRTDSRPSDVLGEELILKRLVGLA